MNVIDIDNEFRQVKEYWRPKAVARFNDQDVKVAKLEGEFVWHHHDETDEVFLVWRGKLRMELRDRTLTLGPGDMLTVPRGVDHRPVAEGEVEVILFESKETRNTGNVVDAKFTAPPAQ